MFILIILFSFSSSRLVAWALVLLVLLCITSLKLITIILWRIANFALIHHLVSFFPWTLLDWLKTFIIAPIVIASIVAVVALTFLMIGFVYLAIRHALYSVFGRLVFFMNDHVVFVALGSRSRFFSRCWLAIVIEFMIDYPETL